MSKKAKTSDRKKQLHAVKAPMTVVECDECGRVKSLSKTRALFAVITEDRLICHHCA